MKIVVMNVAAESGGALTILNEYYNEAFKFEEIEWHFIVSLPALESRENVQVHNFQWVKKSWFHRLFFDLFVAHRIIKKIKGDHVISLQNTLIPFLGIRQTIYFHQLLPFIKKRFKLLENPKFWVYQRIIGKLILYSIRRADKVIVQAQWIKKMFVKDYKIREEKIEVNPPNLNIAVTNYFKSAVHNEKVIYFYPATAAPYKNHQLIVDTCIRLKNKDIKGFEILLTLSGDETTNIRELKHIINNNKLPIKFIGNLSLSEVYEMYSKTILLFPSHIETIGLPLIEAKAHKTPIIAADLEYSREVLCNYENVSYIDPFLTEDLFTIMKHQINSKI